MREEYATTLEQTLYKVLVRAEYGKDPEATRLARKFAISFLLLSPRDFWNYLYDWINEAENLLRRGTG